SLVERELAFLIELEVCRCGGQRASHGSRSRRATFWLCVEVNMLVTFSTKAHPDITMFGDVAVQLLKLAGHSGTVPSAILARDIPATLARLEGGLPPASAEQQEQDEPPDAD